MKESYWGVFVLLFGIISILLVYFFQTLTNINEHNYTLLKETTEAAMIDALDLAAYRKTGVVRIDQEKFVENFVRRFANNAQLSKNYLIEIYDINEEPPKVSIKISSTADTNITGKIMSFSIQNKLDAILEEPHNKPFETGFKPDDPIVDSESTITIGEEGITDIYDTSDDSYLTAEKCDLSASFDSSIIHVNEPVSSNKIQTSYCGELSCFVYPTNAANCSISNNVLTVTGKKAGEITVFLKGNGTKLGGKTFKQNTISIPLTVRNVANSSIAFNSKSSTTYDTNLITVGFNYSNCSSLSCVGCTLDIPNKKAYIDPSAFGLGIHKATIKCSGRYDSNTLTDYLPSADEYELIRYKVADAKISVPSQFQNIVTNNNGKIEIIPTFENCGKLSCDGSCTVQGNKLIINPKTYGSETITVTCSGGYDGYVFYNKKSTTITLNYNKVQDSSVKFDRKNDTIYDGTTYKIGISNSGCIPKSCGDGCSISNIGANYIATITPKANDYGKKTYKVECEGYTSNFVEYRDSYDTFSLSNYKTVNSSISLKDSDGDNKVTVTTKDKINVDIITNNCTVSGCSGASCSNTKLTISPSEPYGDKTYKVTCSGITDNTNYIKYNNSEATYTVTYHGKDKAKLNLDSYSATVTNSSLPMSIVTATTEHCGTLTCSSCQAVNSGTNGRYKVHFVPKAVDDDYKIGLNQITVTCSGETVNNIEYEGVSKTFNFTYSPKSSITLPEGKTVDSPDDVTITATTSGCDKVTCSGCNGDPVNNGNGKYTLKVTPKPNDTKSITATCVGKKVGDGKYQDSTASFSVKYNAYTCPNSLTPINDSSKGWICVKGADSKVEGGTCTERGSFINESKGGGITVLYKGTEVVNGKTIETCRPSCSNYGNCTYSSSVTRDCDYYNYIEVSGCGTGEGECGCMEFDMTCKNYSCASSSGGTTVYYCDTVNGWAHYSGTAGKSDMKCYKAASTS